MHKKKIWAYWEGLFKNHMDIILLFFDHLPTLVDIFYVLSWQKWQVLDHLPTLCCPRGFWMAPYLSVAVEHQALPPIKLDQSYVQVLYVFPLNLKGKIQLW